MSSSEKELEEQLKEAGKSLLNPPSDTEELLKLLDEAEDLLENIEQEPPINIQDAFLPLMKALVSNELFGHSDMDVKVFVASCITEFIRITAPVSLFNDEQMKEIFQLTVAAFEKLSHMSSRCYTKAVSILHTVAMIRSSLLMLDLDCDALILEMFQHFLNVTQSNHPPSVYSSMESIMTRLLNESDEIPLDLLKTLLSSVRKENQTVSPVSWTLGEKIIENCSAKLKPYLMEAVKSMDISLDDYAHVVASVCQNESEDLKHDNAADSGKNLVMEEPTPRAVCPREAVKTVASPTRDEHNARHKSSSKKLRHCNHTKHSKGVDSRDGAQLDNSFSLKAVKSETEPYSAPEKRGRKPNSVRNSEEGYDHAQPENSLGVKAVKSEIKAYSPPKKRSWKPNSLRNPAEGYDHFWISSGRKTKKPAGSRKSVCKGSNNSPTEDRLVGKAALPLTLENVTELPNSQSNNEGAIGVSSLSGQNNSCGRTQRRRGQPKRQIAPNDASSPRSLSAVRQEFSSAQVEERIPQADENLTVESKEISSSEPKAWGNSRGVALAEEASENCIVAAVTAVADKESAIPCVPDEKSQQQPALDAGAGSTNDQSSGRRALKTCRGNNSFGKESTEASGRKNISKSAAKMNEDNKGTPKVVRKRKRYMGTEEVGEELVGSKIKVWWPLDKVFYEGVVSSYDPSKKKHVVLYADGEEETLNLIRQRWHRVGDDFVDVQMENLSKPDASSNTPQKKKRKTKEEPSKQANAGLSSKRISRHGVSAGVSIVECMKSGKSADCSTLDEPKVIDDHEDDQSKESERLKDDPSKENDRLKDDGQISAAGSEADLKTGIDSAQIIPETMTLSKVESPKVEIEPSGKECAKELIELSKGAENASLVP